jgi:hypothetical protein
MERSAIILLILGIVVLAISCSGYDRENFRMEVGKKYALKQWPDSAYIDTLDKFFEQEPIRQSQKQKVEMTMNMGSMVLPKKETKHEKKSKFDAPQNAVQKNEEKKDDSFPEQFFAALYNLSVNPDSYVYGKKYRANGGETLETLLLRVYGARVKRVPKNLSENMLKKINPSADFSSLADGEMVILPLLR